VTVQAILNELVNHTSIHVIVINTSPPPERFSAKKTRLNSDKMRRMASTIRQYLRNIKPSNAVLVFASNRSAFFTVYVPMLLLLARMYHRPFYLKPFGEPWTCT